MSDRVERVPDGLAAVADMALVLSLIATNEGRTPNEVLRSAIAAYQGPPPERAILLALIAELRDVHQMDNFDCWECEDSWPCDTARITDRAEARLREVTGDE